MRNKKSKKLSGKKRRALAQKLDSKTKGKNYSKFLPKLIPNVIGFRKPHARWDDRCKFCEGTGKVKNISNGWDDCIGCQ